MTVYESDLPGVGKKFELELDAERLLVVVIHNTGKRELFIREGEADAERLVTLSDRLARQVGSILEGAHFQPVATESTATLLGDAALLEWVRVPTEAPIIGATLAELAFRTETGATVVAIDREPEAVTTPGPETTIAADDTLVITGTREACQAVEALVTGGDA
jgi:potassium/proton antiporter regulatory subunit, CPA2 family (TC 2.A.37.5.2)